MITEAYVAAIELLLLIAIPVLVMLTLFSWWEAVRLWPHKLPLMIALTNTITGACATWLAWTVLYRDRVGHIPDEMLPVTATVVLLLCLTPMLVTAYLAWLETSRPDDR